MAREYNISRIGGTCHQCGDEIPPGRELVATVRETDEDFQRQDYCPACWEASDGEQDASVLGVWRTRAPHPEAKRKLFVDDEVLIRFFERLADAREPAKIHFRYVLALVLMRKKLLVYDRMIARDDGWDEWQMHFRGDDTVHKVLDPHMDVDEIAAVSAHIGEILEADL